MKKTEGMRWSSLEATEETVCKPFPTKSMCNTDLYTFRLWSFTLVTLPLPSINFLHSEGTCNSVAFVTAQKVGFLSASLMELLSCGALKSLQELPKVLSHHFFFSLIFFDKHDILCQKEGTCSLYCVYCIVPWTQYKINTRQQNQSPSTFYL